MATVSSIIPLWDVAHGQSAECFALYVKSERQTTKKGDPYFKCLFRARHEERQANIWSNHELFEAVAGWKVGEAYRLKVVGDISAYGRQIKLVEIAPVGPDDEADGFSMGDLIDSTHFNPQWLWTSVREAVSEYVREPHLRELLGNVFKAHGAAFRRHPAATKMHHAYASGLLEHTWSLTRLCGFMADHYADYYRALNPPIDRGVLLTAAILHDVGKVFELEADPFEARYSLAGMLVGHIVLGRDILRVAAGQVEGFPAETLLRLEHAVLAHHGRRDFGSPVVPQTIEALILSFADDVDAKVHAAARALMTPGDDPLYTEKVYSLDNRRFYRGVPIPPPPFDEFALGDGRTPA